MLEIENTALAVIDVQGKLAQRVHDHEKVLNHIQHFIKAAEAFKLPVLWSEQAPDKIGDTLASIKSLIAPLAKPIHKRSFSCWGCLQYVEELKKINRRQIIITGIESHVCVYQTAVDLQTHGYQVHIIADAVSSRHEFDHQMAIARMRDHKIAIMSMEMAICELLKTADHPDFKKIIAHIKG